MISCFVQDYIKKLQSKVFEKLIYYIYLIINWLIIFHSGTTFIADDTLKDLNMNLITLTRTF